MWAFRCVVRAHLAADAPPTDHRRADGGGADVDERGVDDHERLPAGVELLARVILFIVNAVSAVPPQPLGVMLYRLLKLLHA